MLRVPYLIVGFQVSRGSPNAATITAEIERTIPWSRAAPIGLGVDDVYALEVPSATMYAWFDRLTAFFVRVNVTYDGQVGWFVQLCKSGDIAPL